jgi:hypothetical protein
VETPWSLPSSLNPSQAGLGVSMGTRSFPARLALRRSAATMAALHRGVGNSIEGVWTVVVRVSVVHSSSAGDPIRPLGEEVEAEQVCFESARQQVCVEAAGNRDRALVRILNVVEDWLGGGGHAPTAVEIDERSYVLASRLAGGVG